MKKLISLLLLVLLFVGCGTKVTMYKVDADIITSNCPFDKMTLGIKYEVGAATFIDDIEIKLSEFKYYYESDTSNIIPLIVRVVKDRFFFNTYYMRVYLDGIDSRDHSVISRTIYKDIYNKTQTKTGHDEEIY